MDKIDLNRIAKLAVWGPEGFDDSPVVARYMNRVINRHGSTNITPEDAEKIRELLDTAGLQYGSRLAVAGPNTGRENKRRNPGGAWLNSVSYALMVWTESEDEMERIDRTLEVDGEFMLSDETDPVDPVRSAWLKDRDDEDPNDPDPEFD